MSKQASDQINNDIAEVMRSLRGVRDAVMIRCLSHDTMLADLRDLTSKISPHATGTISDP